MSGALPWPQRGKRVCANPECASCAERPFTPWRSPVRTTRGRGGDRRKSRHPAGRRSLRQHGPTSSALVTEAVTGGMTSSWAPVAAFIVQKFMIFGPIKEPGLCRPGITRWMGQGRLAWGLTSGQAQSPRAKPKPGSGFCGSTPSEPQTALATGASLPLHNPKRGSLP